MSKPPFNFDMRASSLETDILAKALEDKLSPLAGDDIEAKIHLTNLSVLIAHTRKITFNFNGNAPEELSQFKEWWNKHDKLTPAELWEGRRRTPHGIIALWLREFNKKQRLFVIPDEEKPEEDLTDEQREEIKDPNSFLADSAKNSRGA